MGQGRELGDWSFGVETVKLQDKIGLTSALVVLLGLAFLAGRASGDSMGAPPEELRSRISSSDAKKRSTSAELPFKFLKEVISKVDGPRCSMYPTDTQFALEASRRHGVVLGVLFLADRLFHEWSESKRAPVIVVYGKERFYDPLDWNDFWLRGKSLPEDSSGYGAQE